MHPFKSALVFLIAFSPLALAEPTTVPVVDLNQYLGRWYQISANPMPFDEGCHCSQQTLTALVNGNVGVYNSCNRDSVTGSLSEIRGEASAVDKETNTKFVVDFGFPDKGDYWVVGLAPDYSWAVVSEPEGAALFILSRTPELESKKYYAALAAATSAGVSIAQLKTTVQTGCTYPAL